MGPWCQGGIVLSSWVFCDKKLLCKQFFFLLSHVSFPCFCGHEQFYKNPYFESFVLAVLSGKCHHKINLKITGIEEYGKQRQL